MARLTVLTKRTAVAFWLVAGNVMALYAQAKPPEDYRVKAVFLYNFTQFVEWPPTAFQSSADSLIVGILGEDPFGKHLEEVIEGENSMDRPLVLRRFDTAEEVSGCHVLFINLPMREETFQILHDLQGSSVLTVSDQSGFLEAGGMIQLNSLDNKIHFQINPVASNAANLKISSKLLRVAEVVTPPNE